MEKPQAQTEELTLEEITPEERARAEAELNGGDAKPKVNPATEIKQAAQKNVRPPAAETIEPRSAERPPRPSRPRPQAAPRTPAPQTAISQVAPPPKAVDPTTPATNSRQGGRTMRATREHVSRTTPEGVEMETATHYQTVVPNRARDIASFKKSGYTLADGHELNSDEEVVMEIKKELKDSRYTSGVDNIRQFMNDGEAEELEDGIQRTRAEALEPRTVSQMLDAMDANETADDEDEFENG